MPRSASLREYIQALMRIPIHNIYYLLSYAWNTLEMDRLARINSMTCDTLLDLLATVLVNGMSHVLRGGLDRGYVPQREYSTTLRGKIDFAKTMKQTCFRKPGAFCRYDELHYNVLHNRIVKTTIENLRSCEELSRETQRQLHGIARQIRQIEPLSLTKRHFGLVQLHGNTACYGLLLNICELIYDNFFLTQQDGSWTFKEFVRDPTKMAVLFENFVRNFYRREQSVFRVSRDIIYWDARRLGRTPEGFLPQMETDITLTSPSLRRKIILDAKYYQETLQARYDRDTIISANLYQLHAYLSNLPPDEQYPPCEGLLLYPTVQQDVNLVYDLKGHNVSISTINLNQPWQQIHQDLLRIIGLTERSHGA